MKKKELISRVAEILRQNNIRKPISVPKQVFHISDDEGNQKDFIVRKVDKTVAYNTDDVASVVETCLLVIEDAIKNGESIYIHGFGTLGVHRRAARKTKHPDTGELMEVKARFVPKFTFGHNLRTAARAYELSLKDRVESPTPRYDDFIEESDE